VFVSTPDHDPSKPRSPSTGIHDHHPWNAHSSSRLACSHVLPLKRHNMSTSLHRKRFSYRRLGIRPERSDGSKLAALPTPVKLTMPYFAFFIAHRFINVTMPVPGRWWAQQLILFRLFKGIPMHYLLPMVGVALGVFLVSRTGIAEPTVYLVVGELGR